jgi:uncharacterized peroxidase-related enzyme
VLFAVIHVVSRRTMPDAARLIFYRPEFYGTPMKVFTQVAMRGPSSWSVGDRELMAALVSQSNACAFCIGAHTATAATAYDNEALVAAVLTDLDTAPIVEPLRATLRLLGKLTRENTVDADDMRAVLAAGASREQIEDALAVCCAFNITNRLADAFGFTVLDPDSFKAGAQVLLKRGYQ